MNEKLKAALRKYQQMRNTQKAYFKLKQHDLIKEAKKLEKQCDQAMKELAAMVQLENSQTHLF